MDEASFRETVGGEGPVLVELWAPWCGPCKVMAPSLERATQRYAGRVRLLKINADESAEVVRSLKVYGIPTVIGYAQGKERFRRTGMQAEGDLDGLFAALEAGAPPPKRSLLPQERVFRLSAGALLAVLGAFLGTWLLLPAGAVVMFTGVYDRCPIWQAVSGWLERKTPGD
ncbi:MAG: DUF2892 domain-containing protein [Anaerolineales bacterium]|nr:DUF2892 domain-containing protein [Anaerolineales bacterium]